MSQGQALLLAVGGLAAWALIFVVWWMLVGYGTSIAVRTYRWAMRHHQPAAAVGLNSYASQRNNR